MVFRLAYPHVSEDRCRACKILGGVTLRDDVTRKRFLRLPDLDEAQTPPIGGDLVMEPCVAPHELARQREKEGHECPRREYFDANVGVASLIGILTDPLKAELFQPLFEAMYGMVGPAARERVLMRMALTLGDAELDEYLNPRRDAKGAFK